MNEVAEISKTLKQLSPAKRLKYIRQKILKQNQVKFCEDGIVRSGTLKAIESQRLKIGDKIAERIAHKLRLEGVICEKELFLDENSNCEVKLDPLKKVLTGNSLLALEDMRIKIETLQPIIISNEELSPFIPSNTILLVRELSKDEIFKLNNTLCYIKGKSSSLYFLTYADEKIIAEYNSQKRVFTNDFFDFCDSYVVELIYFGDKP